MTETPTCARGSKRFWTDIIVAACAKRHGVRLEHHDRHFDLIEQADPSEG